MKLRAMAIVLGVLALTVVASDAQSQQAWNSVTLAWTTPGDDSLTGTASQFDIRYSTALITAANFAAATRATGAPVPATPGTRQTMLLTGLQPATQYWFAIKTADDIPNWSGLSNVISRTTTSAPDNSRPAPLAIQIGTVTDTTVTLTWNAVGDDSLTGTAASYDVRYSTLPITAANWASATQSANEPAPGAPGTPQSFTVRNLARQTTYYFAARAADEGSNISALSNTPTTTTTDTMRPGAILDLTVGFVWTSVSQASSIAARGPVLR